MAWWNDPRERADEQDAPYVQFAMSEEERREGREAAAVYRQDREEQRSEHTTMDARAAGDAFRAMVGDAPIPGDRDYRRPRDSASHEERPVFTQDVERAEVDPDVMRAQDQHHVAARNARQEDSWNADPRKRRVEVFVPEVAAEAALEGIRPMTDADAVAEERAYLARRRAHAERTGTAMDDASRADYDGEVADGETGERDLLRMPTHRFVDPRAVRRRMGGMREIVETERLEVLGPQPGHRRDARRDFHQEQNHGRLQRAVEAGEGAGAEEAEAAWGHVHAAQDGAAARAGAARRRHNTATSRGSATARGRATARRRAGGTDYDDGGSAAAAATAAAEVDDTRPAHVRGRGAMGGAPRPRVRAAEDDVADELHGGEDGMFSGARSAIAMARRGGRSGGHLARHPISDDAPATGLEEEHSAVPARRARRGVAAVPRRRAAAVRGGSAGDLDLDHMLDNDEAGEGGVDGGASFSRGSQLAARTHRQAVRGRHGEFRDRRTVHEGEAEYDGQDAELPTRAVMHRKQRARTSTTRQRMPVVAGEGDEVADEGETFIDDHSHQRLGRAVGRSRKLRPSQWEDARGGDGVEEDEHHVAAPRRRPPAASHRSRRMPFAHDDGDAAATEAEAEATRPHGRSRRFAGVARPLRHAVEDHGAGQVVGGDAGSERAVVPKRRGWAGARRRLPPRGDRAGGDDGGGESGGDAGAAALGHRARVGRARRGAGRAMRRTQGRAAQSLGESERGDDDDAAAAGADESLSAVDVRDRRSALGGGTRALRRGVRSTVGTAGSEAPALRDMEGIEGVGMAPADRGRAAKIPSDRRTRQFQRRTRDGGYDALQSDVSDTERDPVERGAAAESLPVPVDRRSSSARARVDPRQRARDARRRQQSRVG